MSDTTALFRQLDTTRDDIRRTNTNAYPDGISNGVAYCH